MSAPATTGSATSSNGTGGQTSGSPVKAVLINIDKGGPPIPCMFNPNEYAFSKQNDWSMGKTKGANVPKLEFGGGKPATLELELFFDTYSSKRDVRKEYTDAIWELTMIDESLKDKKNKKGRPPKVRFQWGKAWSFEAVITSISQRFSLFLEDGTPVRATMTVTFQQIKDEKYYPSQNPTSGGTGGGTVWTVREGDSLAWISHVEYGDPNLWRRIADANNLTRVRRLRPGMVLEIPNG
jgi:nucleoid-associated protein YgaU